MLDIEHEMVITNRQINLDFASQVYQINGAEPDLFKSGFVNQDLKVKIDKINSFRLEKVKKELY